MRILIATAAAVLMAAAPVAAEETPATPSPVPSAAEGVQIPDFATKTWIVVDAESGDILAGQNIDEQRPMASTLKTLTALTLLPRLQYESTYEARAEETLTEGMHVGVLAGSTYTVAELFHGMMMRSGNDAAVALADAYGYQRTLDAMNAEAQRIGATRTVAMSPNGLDKPGQVSTAADMAQIYRVAIQDPRLQEIMTAREFEFPAQPPKDPTKPQNTFTIYNNDNILNSNYPGFLGGKSGFTSNAGRTYVAGAERDGRRLVVALMGIGGGTTATARDVLDWAFQNSGQLQPIGQLPEVPESPEIAPEPAAAGDPTDVAPLPPDPQAQQEGQAVAEQAIAAVQQIAANLPQPPSADEVVAGASAAVEQAGQYAQVAGNESFDPTAIAQAAQDAAAVAAGTASTTGTGIAAEMFVGGFPQSAFVSAEPVTPPPAERGFFATLLVGLFKALMWTVLLLGIAVVLLRIRAVRRQKRRRAEHEAAMRERSARSRATDPTPRRTPSRTG
jgi:D-alanyl-D-alanine carboxypeptidase (penicillin-binding protein 5/6)